MVIVGRIKFGVKAANLLSYIDFSQVSESFSSYLETPILLPLRGFTIFINYIWRVIIGNIIQNDGPLNYDKEV